MSEMTREHVLVVKRSALGSDRSALVFPNDHPAAIAIKRDAALLREVAAMIEGKLEEKP